jgi:hypothetical protein
MIKKFSFIMVILLMSFGLVYANPVINCELFAEIPSSADTIYDIWVTDTCLEIDFTNSNAYDTINLYQIGTNENVELFIYGFSNVNIYSYIPNLQLTLGGFGSVGGNNLVGMGNNNLILKTNLDGIGESFAFRNIENFNNVIVNFSTPNDNFLYIGGFRNIKELEFEYMKKQNLGGMAFWGNVTLTRYNTFVNNGVSIVGEYNNLSILNNILGYFDIYLEYQMPKYDNGTIRTDILNHSHNSYYSNYHYAVMDFLGGVISNNYFGVLNNNNIKNGFEFAWWGDFGDYSGTQLTQFYDNVFVVDTINGYVGNNIFGDTYLDFIEGVELILYSEVENGIILGNQWLDYADNSNYFTCDSSIVNLVYNGYNYTMCDEPQIIGYTADWNYPVIDRLILDKTLIIVDNGDNGNGNGGNGNGGSGSNGNNDNNNANSFFTSFLGDFGNGLGLFLNSISQPIVYLILVLAIGSGLMGIIYSVTQMIRKGFK